MNNQDAFYRIEIVTKAEEVSETSVDLRLFYVVDGSFSIKKVRGARKDKSSRMREKPL